LHSLPGIYPERKTSLHSLPGIYPERKTSLHSLPGNYPEHKTSLHSLPGNYPEHKTSLHSLPGIYPERKTSLHSLPGKHSITVENNYKENKINKLSKLKTNKTKSIMNKFKLFHLQANKLKLANLAGLSDETLSVIEPKKSLLGETGEKIVDKLRADSTAMKTEMDKPRSSLLTAQIKKANDICDATIDDIKRSVKAGSRSTVIDKSSAGKMLEHFMKPFWDLNRKPLMSQIAMTGEMLSRYQNDANLQAAAKDLAIDGLFYMLAPYNTTLSGLYNQRLAEYAAETPAASGLRETVAEDYNSVCDVLVKTLTTDPEEEDLITLFNKTNDIRKKYSALSPARINLSCTVTEPLHTHTYTGKAITPIPVLYYDGTELVFAVDFSVTYKNNIEVGEATAVMHGKGRFIGQHTRKFNIARTL
jgi:hypothetical protein